MRKLIDPFTVMLPHIDLHGETTMTIEYLIDSFIRDNIKLENAKVVIIHGKGREEKKNKTHEILKHNHNVSKYYIDSLNDGQTIAILNLTKP